MGKDKKSKISIKNLFFNKKKLNKIKYKKFKLYKKKKKKSSVKKIFFNKKNLNKIRDKKVKVYKKKKSPIKKVVVSKKNLNKIKGKKVKIYKKKKSPVKTVFSNKKKIKDLKSKKSKLQKNKKGKIKNLIFNKNMIMSLLLMGALSFTLVKSSPDVSFAEAEQIEETPNVEYNLTHELDFTPLAEELDNLTVEIDEQQQAIIQKQEEEKRIAEEKAAEEARIAEEKRIAEERRHWTYKMDVNGTVLNYIYDHSCLRAPASGCAVWEGSASTTDGLGSWFVGHNPGDFNCAYNLGYGDPVTVYDENGNNRTYYVCDIFEIPQSSYYGTEYTVDEFNNILSSRDVLEYNNVNYLPRVYPGGETIALQSCTGKGTGMIRLTIAR